MSKLRLFQSFYAWWITASVLACATTVSGAEETTVESATGRLVVRILELDWVEGSVIIALWDDAGEWVTGEPLRGAQIEVRSDGPMELVFEDLPAGYYGLSAFHDENNNRKLDLGRWGAPREAYGFSNNARGRFGPARWEDARFAVGEGKSVQVLELRKFGAPARNR